MSRETLEFRSKIGAIMIVPIVILILTGAPATAMAMSEGRPLLAAVFSLPFALVAWIMFTTKYLITADHLVIRCAFLSSRVPLPSITRVRPTRTILSAPALSLDRLEIAHDGGIAVISPANREGFIAAIRARCPRAEILVV